MKALKIVSLSLVLVVLALAFATPVLASQHTQDELPVGFNLTAKDLVYVGFATSGLVAVLNLMADFSVKHKINIPNWIKQAIVIGVTYGLAFYLAPFAIPAMPTFTGDLGTDISLFINGWLAPFGVVLYAWFGIATGFYKWFLKNLKDKAGSQLNITGYS